MKLVFCGTPHFAVPTLGALLAAGHQIPLVVTQPDRPVGRAKELMAPPVKVAVIGCGQPRGAEGALLSMLATGDLKAKLPT